MFLWIWYPNVSDLWLLLYCHHQANVSTCGKISFGASVLPDEPFHFKRKEKKGSKIEEADGENVERTGGIEREESEALVDWQTQKKRAENSPGRHFHIQEAAEWNLFHTHTHTHCYRTYKHPCTHPLNQANKHSKTNWCTLTYTGLSQRMKAWHQIGPRWSDSPAQADSIHACTMHRNTHTHLNTAGLSLKL